MKNILIIENDSDLMYKPFDIDDFIDKVRLFIKE